MTAAAADTSEERQLELRPEARPRPFKALDAQQQAAFQRVVNLLHAATVAAPTSAPFDADVVPIRTSATQIPDTDRSGRNILVDGERGTGKTTLLLSLARALLRRNEPYQEKETEEKLPPALTNRIGVLRRRLIWLETLDMEPLSSDTNLLGAVLARIEDAVGTRLSAPDDAMVTSLLYPTRDVQDLPRELVRLQTSIALIFDGNLRARAGRLDPDTFAVEARRTERERLGLDRRFADVLAALSAALDRKPELENPVFVLPVDDLDLNPVDCVPLLRLLRSAHSPHLIVIMAADIALLTTVLRLKYRGDFARISDPLKLAEEDRTRADDLADSAFRKHLPPSQQVHLALVEPAFALTYPAEGPEPRHLLATMRTVKLASDDAQLVVDRRFGDLSGSQETVRSVAAPLLPAGEVDQATLAADLAGYSWPEVLRLPMRQVIDLHLASAAAGGGPGRPRDAGEPAVLRSARIRLQRWRATADLHRSDGPDFGVTPRISVDDVDVDVGNDDDDDVVLGRLVVRTSVFHGWRVQTRGGPLPPAESSAYVGCLELAGEDLDRGPAAARSTPRVDPPRTTIIATTADGSEFTVPWPWVRHSTFWAYERAASWLQRAEQKWRKEEQDDPLFGSWITVMTAQLFPLAGDWTGAWTDEQPSSWEKLDARLGNLRRPGDTSLAHRWRIAVGLLCTREMGMTKGPRLATLGDLAGEIDRRRHDRRRGLPEPHRRFLDSIAPLEDTDSGSSAGPASSEAGDDAAGPP